MHSRNKLRSAIGHTAEDGAVAAAKTQRIATATGAAVATLRGGDLFGWGEQDGVDDVDDAV